MTTIEQATTAIRENLHQIFGEADASKRQQAISRIWTSSDESVFVDPEKTCHGHTQIEGCVADLQKKFAGWVFTETTPVTVLPASGEAKARFAKVRWGYGPPGETPKVYGEDVAMVVEGKLQSLCAFIDGP